MQGTRVNSLYYLEAKVILGDVSALFHNESKLWHLRITHISEGGLNELTKQGIIPGNNKYQPAQCEDCISGKHKRSHYNPSRC